MDPRFEANDGMIVRFHSDGAADYVEIRWDQSIKAHAENVDVIRRKVQPLDLERWPREWAAFDGARAKVVETGTPLSEIPGIDRAEIVLIRSKGIANCEALAAADHFVLSVLGDKGEAWQKIAKLILASKPQSTAKVEQKKAA